MPEVSSASPGDDPISSLTLHCFGPRRDLPDWLMRPLQALQTVTDRGRPVTARTAALVEMVDGVDALFTDHLVQEWEWFHTSEADALPAHVALPRWVEALFQEGARALHASLLPDLREDGMVITRVAHTDEEQRAWLHRYFLQRIYPRLTPLAVDPGRPFPFISNESLNLLVELRRPEAADGPAWPLLFARVKIPPEIPALLAVPAIVARQFSGEGQPVVYVWTADLVRFFVHHLFPGMPVRRVCFFRIVRGETPLPGAPRLASARHRRQEDRPVVRVDVERCMEEPVLAWLVQHLHIPAYAVARHESLLEWHGLPGLLAQVAAQ